MKELTYLLALRIHGPCSPPPILIIKVIVKKYTQLHKTELSKTSAKCTKKHIPMEPRHRGLGEEWTTSVHSLGWVEGSNPSLSLF